MTCLARTVIKKVFSVVLCVCILLLSRQASIAADQVFHEDFHSLDQWMEIHNAQSLDPALPCRDESGPTVWKHTEFGFGAEIRDGVPCFIVLGGPEIEVTSETVEISWQWYFTDPYQDRNFILHWQDAENWFGIHLFGNEFYLEGKNQGQAVVVSPPSARYPFSANKAHSFRVRENRETGEVKIWVNQVMIAKATVPDISEFPFRPSLAASVGHGVRSSQSYFRDLFVWNGPTAPQPASWKQTDARWAENEYDSASVWSTEATTIGRWGCALTSAAMILDAAGVKQLPSGDPLNPGSLNTWLKSETDGYLGPGLLNWRAIAKLALWHNQEFGTTKLEFSALTPENKEEWLRTELSRRFPIILEQPSHFVVATDWIESKSSASILDPGYTRDSLASYDDTYLSARIFTPSATNLQGATLVTPVWAHLKATTALGDPVRLTPLESTAFSLQGDFSVTEWQMWDAAPWGLGPLLLTVQAPQPVPLLGAWYSEDGQQSTVPNTLAPNQVTSIESSAPTAVLSDQDIARLLSWQEIKSPAVWLWRNAVLDTPSAENAAQYRWLLNQAHKNGWLSSTAHSLLLIEGAVHFPP
jgi:hypothetical protein